jgi:hypothetical protein
MLNSRLQFKNNQLEGRRGALVLAGLLGVHLVLLVSLRFTVWPEMVLFPWLLDNGFELYRDLVNPYFPLFTWLLWVWYWLLGFGFWQLKVLTWVVILVTDLLVYGVTVRLTGNRWAGLVALGFFVLWQPVLEGNGLWHDLALTPFLLLTLWALSSKFKVQNPKVQFKVRNWNLWVVGLLLGVMVMVKQSAGWYLFAASAATFVSGIKYYVLRGKREKLVLDYARTVMGRLLPLWVPMLVMMGGVGVWFWSKGLWSDFWLWTVQLPLGMVGSLPGHVLWPTWRQLGVMGVVILPLAGLLISKLKAQNSNLQLNTQNWNTNTYLWLFWIASLGLAYPRFSFFHLQSWLALTVLLFGVMSVKRKANSEKLQINKFVSGEIKSEKLVGEEGASSLGVIRRGLLGLGFVIWVVGVVVIQGWFLKSSWGMEERFLEREVYELVEYIGGNYEGERLAVINGPQLLYFLTDQLPPKPWADNFSWFMEVPGVQGRIVEGMEREGVEVVVTRWVKEGERDFKIGDYYPGEIGEYLEENFAKVDEVGGYWILVESAM